MRGEVKGEAVYLLHDLLEVDVVRSSERKNLHREGGGEHDEHLYGVRCSQSNTHPVNIVPVRDR